MAQHDIIYGVIVEQSQSLTFEEFCQATHSEKELIIKMIEYQLVQPAGKTPSEWRFDSNSLRRGRIAASFYRDLDINLQGIALALELLDKIKQLEYQVKTFEKIVK